MNREELLDASLGPTEAPYRVYGVKVVEEIEGPNVLGHLDIFYRRVVIRTPLPVGGADAVSGSTLVQVAAFSQLATDPALDPPETDQLINRLFDEAEREAATHQLVLFSTIFAPETFIPLFRDRGYEHPDGADNPRFLIHRFGDDPWPEGRVDTRGEW